MEIQTIREGRLSEKEVENIIKDYLKTHGYEVTRISFEIKEEQDKDDSFAQYPLTPVFKGIKFICK